MRHFSGFLVSLTVILNFIVLSSQSGSSPSGFHSRRAAHAGTEYSLRRSRSRSPSARHPPLEFSTTEFDPAGFNHAGLPPAEYDPAWFPASDFDLLEAHSAHLLTDEPLHAKTPSPPTSSFSRSSQPSPSTRCMVPPTILPSANGHGCTIDKLPFIRLISKKNPRVIFALQRYTFPVDKKLKLRTSRDSFIPMATGEQIVITTSSGEIFAILESTYSLAGIYMYGDNHYRRVKINNRSGKVTLLTEEEISECPVGINRQIKSHYRVKRLE